MQRLEVFIAVMLARERRRHADTAADGCTELAAALAALPSRPLETVADAVVALDCAATPAPDAQGWRASWGPPIPDGEVARHFVSCPICACRVASERFLNVHLNEAHALA